MGKLAKRILIAAAVIVLIIVVGLIILFAVIDKHNKNYWEYAKPYGTIEKKYTPLGPCTVSTYETKSSAYGKFEIWYPSAMKDGAKYPLVIMANGTGVKASQYTEVFKHLASWGFVVAGNEDDNSRSGASSEATLEYVLSLNSEKGSIFYGNVDVENIGIAGHSQGGVGAINAATQQSSASKYKAIWAASATSRYHAVNLDKDADPKNDNHGSWKCDPSKIKTACFMVAGTGATDAGNMDRYTATLGKNEVQGICPKWWLDECYADMPDTVTKVVARQCDKDHGDMLRYADGYMTAWFMYHLKGQTTADFFSGANAEIKNNKNWQDVRASV